MRIVEYLDKTGQSPFARWFGRIDAAAASKVKVALNRLEAGNLSNVKSVGTGVFEYKIDWGAGYRVYFGRDGDQIVVLLAGGTKQRQQDDIDDAKGRWLEWRRRKKDE